MATAPSREGPAWAPSLLLALAVLGLLARVVVVALSVGTNDLPTWRGFALDIDAHGLWWLYEHEASFNHPPLMGLWAWLLLKVEAWTQVPYRFVFKAPLLLAEIAIAALLWKRWRPRSRLEAAAAVALAAWSLDTMLVSAYHGNTDVLVALGALAACLLLDAERPLGAGLALGLAINVKLVPVLLIAPLLLSLRDWRSARRFVGGLAVGAVPFAVVLATHGAAFAQHALAYASSYDNWGLSFMVERWAEDSRHAPLAVAARDGFLAWGRGLLFAVTFAVAVAARRAGTLDRCQLGALTLALFLVVTSGFAVQYTVYVGPLLFAASLRWGALYGATAGLFVAFVYFAFWDGQVPAYSLFTSGFPLPVARVGLVAWGVLLGFSAVTLWHLRRRVGSGAPNP